jgi:hypothetical protein
MQIDNLSTPDNGLQLMMFHGTMPMYLSSKGGHCDSNGRLLNSRGGVKEAPITPGHGSAALAGKQDARIQDRRFLAHQSDRATAVGRGATQQEKINTLSVARLQPVSFQPADCNLSTCYLLSILSHFATTTGSNRKRVVA